MRALAFLSLSFGEMLVVATVALLVFGGRLPDVMRNLGRTYAKFRQGLNEVAHPIRQEFRRLDVASPLLRRPEGAREAPPASLPTRPDEPAGPGAPEALPPPRYDAPAGDVPDDGRGMPRQTTPPAKERPADGHGVADEPPPV